MLAIPLVLNCSVHHLQCERNLKFSVSRPEHIISPKQSYSSFCVITLSEDTTTHLCQKSKHRLRLSPQSFTWWVHLLNYLNYLLIVLFLQVPCFCHVIIVDPHQVSPSLPSPCQSLTPGLPTKLSLSTLPAEHLFWNGAFTIALHFFAQHLSMAHYLQNWAMLLSMAHKATALSLFLKKKCIYFSHITGTHTKPFCSDYFLCLDVFPTFIK